MDLLAMVKARLRQQYPEMADVEPSAVEATGKVTIFTFHKEVEAEDGALFPKIVRVTVDSYTGAIVKIMVSTMGPKP